MEFMEVKRVPTPDYRRKYSFDSTLSRSSTSSDPDDVVPSAIPSHLRPTRSVASLMVPSEVMKKHFHTLEIQEALNNTSTSARNTSSKAFSHSSSGTSVFFSFGESDQSGALIDPNGQILEKPNLRIFRFAELKKATKNFCPDTVLGEAVWGKVYKGWIDGKLVSASRNGSPKIAVAIKKTSGRWQGFRERQEMRSEVYLMGKLAHPNLVKLLGYCREDKELLLVYEYMPKGSLANHLFQMNLIEQLSWGRRMRIALGAARGLAFLHTFDEPVIYRGFVPFNILLDENYNAKISDHGLATPGPSGGGSYFPGTLGYIAPECFKDPSMVLLHLMPIDFRMDPHLGVFVDLIYANYMGDAEGHPCLTSDLYAVGVVLLQLLTGLRAIELNRPEEQRNLVDWTKPYLSDERNLRTIMDPRMEGQYSLKTAFEVAKLAVKCLLDDPNARPAMKEVVEVLQKIAGMEKAKES